MRRNESEFEALLETEITITKDRINKVLWKTMITKGTIIYAIIVLLGIIVSMLGILRDPVRAFFWVTICLLFAIFLHKREVNKQVHRMGALEGVTELRLGVSFGKEKIRTKNLCRGNVVYLYYGSITKFVETNDYYVLQTNAKDNIIVSKFALIETQQEDEFLLLIKKKCKNVK